MFESINLRDESVPDLLVVVRLGSNTLLDEHLVRSTAECHARWGIWGFSVLEVPGGDYDELARLRPIVTTRRRLLVAHGVELIAAGFPLLPTLDAPHWTVTLVLPTSESFAAVRSHFDGPDRKPCLGRSDSAGTMSNVADLSLDDLWFDPNSVGADMVVECWISHGPRGRRLGLSTRRRVTGSLWATVTRLRSGRVSSSATATACRCRSS